MKKRTSRSSSGLRGRDRDALAELYDRVADRAYGLAYRILNDGGAAEDAVHDAFVAIWERVDRLDAARGRVESLALTIVRYKALDAARARSRRGARSTELDFDLADEDVEDMTDAVSRSLQMETVTEALREITEDQRQVIELAYFGGLSMREIAEEVSAPVGTVKSRARLGMAKLREALGVTLDG